MNDNDKVFLDTNLIIYAHTNLEVHKQKQVQQIIVQKDTFISTQVFKEAANVLYKKFRFDWHDIRRVLQEMNQNNEIYVNTYATIHRACYIAERYGFSFYDSLIITAALECNCNILYSEDLQHEQVIEKSLVIKNPFL